MSDRELAAEFVLGELDEARRAEVERRLGGDAALRAEVEAMRALAGDLEQLPAEAWPAAGAAGAAGPAASEAGPAAPGRRRLRLGGFWRVRPALALAGVLAALLLGGAIGAALEDGGGGEPGDAPRIALQALPDSPAAHGEVAMPSEGEMVLSVSDLPATAAGQFYELWLLDEAGRTVPVASFRVGGDGTARVRVPLPADPARFQFFDVSLQDVDAGPEHSGDSLLRGPTAPS